MGDFDAVTSILSSNYGISMAASNTLLGLVFALMVSLVLFEASKRNRSVFVYSLLFILVLEAFLGIMNWFVLIIILVLYAGYKFRGGGNSQ